MKTYTIWTVSPHTGDKKDCVAMYHNRGHAIARLRGLRRRAWINGLDTEYTISK